MHQLRTKAIWKLTIIWLSLLCKTHATIQSLNTRSLPLHATNIDNDHNLKSSHIICFNETKLKFKFFDIIHSLPHTKNYQSLMVHGNMGTMLFYNTHEFVFNKYQCLPRFKNNYNNFQQPKSMRNSHYCYIQTPYITINTFFQCTKTNHAHSCPKIV
jgi:hypothetical protein